MFAIDSQTSGPNWLTFLGNPWVTRWGDISKKGFGNF